MFIGHIALAFAAKKVTPRVSLATLLVAAQWADILWPVFLAMGIEHVRMQPGNPPFERLDFTSFPYSHSLAASIAWGVLFGLVYRAIAGGRRTLWLLAALVVSHWVLDYIVHVPDLPLYPGSGRFGLSLWNSPAATIGVEGLMYVAGVTVYLRTTRARDRVGRWAFLGLAVLLLILYVAAAFGPPPPSLEALWITALSGAALFTLWAWWVDRHRDAA